MCEGTENDAPAFSGRGKTRRALSTPAIRRLSLFGSTLKGTDRPDSDVDLLVEFEPGREPGLIGFAEIEMELCDLLGGRRVDLRTARDLSRYFRDEVLRTARVQYVA